MKKTLLLLVAILVFTHVHGNIHAINHNAQVTMTALPGKMHLPN
jgi:hypothetical protein